MIIGKAKNKRAEESAAKAEKRIADAEAAKASVREGYCVCFLHDEYFPDLPRRFDYREPCPPTVCLRCQGKAMELHKSGELAKLAMGNRGIPGSFVTRGGSGVDKRIIIPRPGLAVPRS